MPHSRLVLGALLLSAALGGCVAPEELPTPRRATRAIPAPAAPIPGLEPAPTANRAMRAPTAQPVLQVDGLSGSKKPASP